MIGIIILLDYNFNGDMFVLHMQNFIDDAK
jgi:hypothetical protein